jgi:hypothetical protein
MSQLQTERYKEEGRAQKETVPIVCCVCLYRNTHKGGTHTTRIDNSTRIAIFFLSL